MKPDTQALAFREASSMQELEMLLKLRHAAPEENPGFRLDAYDLKSWHLGLFMETQASTEPIGYLRVVENSGIADWRVRQLATNHPEAFVDAAGDPAPLPILADWPDLPALRQSYDRLAGLDGRIVEVTSLTLAPGREDLGLDLFMIESAIAAFFFALSVDAAFMTTSVTQQEPFAKLGFAVADGTREVRIGSQGHWAVCLLATPDHVKPLLRPCILEQAHRYRSAERITMDLEAWMASVGAVA